MGKLSLKSATNKLNEYIYIFMLLCIVIAHVTISYFITNFLNTQFFISSFIILIFLIQLSLYIVQVNSKSVQLNLIDLIVLVFYGYIFINNLFLSITSHSEEFINFSAIFCVYFIIRQQQSTLNFTYLRITALLIICIESLFCFLQWRNILPNLNSNYIIGGSYGHPAFTAISISILVPYFINPSKEYNCKEIFFNLLIPFALLLLLVVSLKSRAALLSAILSFSAIYILPKIQNLKRLKFVVLSFFTGLIIFVTVFIKSDSSLGRIFIWKKCIPLIKNHLFFGVGFGKFAFEYNKYQSLFFSKSSHSNKEAFLADYAESAFNEFFQFTVETGLVGITLFLALVVCLLYYKKETINESFFNAILCSFIPLFLGWSVLRYFPIGVFFFIALGLLSTQMNNEILFNFKIESKKIKPLLLCTILFAISIFIYNRSHYLTLNWSIRNNKDSHYLDNLNRAFSELQYSDSYIYKYTDELIKKNKYEQAAFITESTNKWLNSPALYYYLYKIHLEQKKFDKAIGDLDYLMNISPSKIYPTYAMAKLYYSLDNKIKGDSLTEKILKSKPKIINADVILMKEELKTYLKK